jgi:hypothetical protein
VADLGAAAASSCGIASIRFASCSSSQPENGAGTGDGNTTRDCVFSPSTLSVRAERAGACTPTRPVYQASLIAVDVCGNETMSRPVEIPVWHDRNLRPPAGTVRFSTGSSQDTREGTNGAYATGCGAGSPAANGTSRDHSDADPEMEISQSAAMSVNSLKIGKASGAVQLNWTEPSLVAAINVTRFHVYRLDPATLFWTQIAEVTKQTHAYLDLVLSDGADWQYKVTAVIK